MFVYIVREKVRFWSSSRPLYLVSCVSYKNLFNLINDRASVRPVLMHWGRMNGKRRQYFVLIMKDFYFFIVSWLSKPRETGSFWLISCKIFPLFFYIVNSTVSIDSTIFFLLILWWTESFARIFSSNFKLIALVLLYYDWWLVYNVESLPAF